MSWYNMTIIDGSDALTFTQGINQHFMFGQLGIILLVVITIISFRSISERFNYPSELVFTISMFLISTLSFIMYLIELVPQYVPFIPFGLFAIGLIISILSLR